MGVSPASGQMTFDDAAHALDAVREAPDRPGLGGATGWVAVCVCGVEGAPMQGPRSAARWLEHQHIGLAVSS